MQIELDRIGKMAMLAAMTSREEEDILKQIVAKDYKQYKLAVTFITGSRNEVMKSLTKSAIGCALQNEIVKPDPGAVHAVMHAALEAVTGITNHILLDAALKLKMAIVSDGKWVAVALYGDSAIHPITNHERAGLGIMHI